MFPLSYGSTIGSLRENTEKNCGGDTLAKQLSRVVPNLYESFGFYLLKESHKTIYYVSIEVWQLVFNQPSHNHVLLRKASSRELSKLTCSVLALRCPEVHSE